MDSSTKQISPELLNLLRCPETMQPLHMATAEVLQQVLQRQLVDRGGKPVSPLSAGLLREDGTVLYPIRDGIPILLKEAAISLRP